MEPFLGEIRLFGGNFAPVGWAICDGSLQAIAANQALFALLGTTFGGDGVTTFALPDLRGRAPVSQGNGPGLTPRVIGQPDGAEAITLVSTQIPSHTHAFTATTAAATDAAPGPSTVLAAMQPSAGTPRVFYCPSSVTGNNFELDTLVLELTGGSQAHDNMMPSLAVSIIISLEGVFPPRN